MIAVKSTNVRYKFEVDENVTFVVVSNKRICTIPNIDIETLSTILRYRREVKELEQKIERESQGLGNTPGF